MSSIVEKKLEVHCCYEYYSKSYASGSGLSAGRRRFLYARRKLVGQDVAGSLAVGPFVQK